MRFSCDSVALQRGISVGQTAVQSKIANPVVENVLMAAEEGQVLFIGTNLSQTIRCSVEAEVEKPGQIVVPARYMNNLAREIGKGKVEVSLKRNRLHISCGSGDYRLSGLPADEFPPFLPVSEGPEITFSTAEIKEVIKKTVFCASSERARFELDGVKVEGSGRQMMFVATDGRRLSAMKLLRESEIDREVSVLIPTRTWQELARVLPEGQAVRVIFGEGKVMFEAGDVTMLSSLLGDNFPPYEQIIPKQFARMIKVSRQEFELAVRRALVLASEMTNQVILEVGGGKMIVRGESLEVGDAKDVITAEYAGEPITISYRGDFILDFLRSASSEKVSIEINDPVSPAAYREADNPNYLHIIMPMKVPDSAEAPRAEE